MSQDQRFELPYPFGKADPIDPDPNRQPDEQIWGPIACRDAVREIRGMLKLTDSRILNIVQIYLVRLDLAQQPRLRRTNNSFGLNPS